MRRELAVDAVIVTLDRDGLVVADAQHSEHLPTTPREVYDITGAGDMVLAICGYGYAVGWPLRETALLANADGNVSSITAENSATGNQTTQFVYGTTLANSDVASSLLKREEIYPDSVGGSDKVVFRYNRQQQVTSVTDQAGTVHSYDYDKLGRMTQDRITTLGSGVDSAVRRIAMTYEVRGMREKLTSYDNATVGSGNIVNEVKFTYNDFSQLTKDYQSHAGGVTT